LWVADDDEKNNSVSELFSQGNATLKNRNKSRKKLYIFKTNKFVNL